MFKLKKTKILILVVTIILCFVFAIYVANFNKKNSQNIVFNVTPFTNDYMDAEITEVLEIRNSTYISNNESNEDYKIYVCTPYSKISFNDFESEYDNISNTGYGVSFGNGNNSNVKELYGKTIDVKDIEYIYDLETGLTILKFEIKNISSEERNNIFKQQELVRKVWSQHLNKYSDSLLDYRIDDISIKLGENKNEIIQAFPEEYKESDILAMIEYSVKPKDINDMTWSAGNGYTEGDWILAKVRCISLRDGEINMSATSFW